MLSHKQIPRLLVKNFKNGDRPYYFDLKTCNINKCGPKKLGAEEGYYDENIEKALNSNVEDEFGKVVNSLIDAVNNRKDFVITKEIDEIVKKFFWTNLYRSNYAVDLVKENSYVLCYFGDYAIRNILIDYHLKDKTTISKEFEDYKISAVVNNTNVPFVTSRNCFYEFQSKRMLIEAIPLNPKILLILVPPEYQLGIFTIDKVEDI